MDAVALGRDYAPSSSIARCRSACAPREGAKGKILVSGNEAAGLGAIYAGATVCAWYPITPSTSLAEAYEKYAKRLRVTKDGRRLYGIVQAEDELAAIGVAIGGGWNGARAFTATSGPGISLMSEFLGLAYFAEVPVVLFNIQRGGPSTGMPTRTQQSDILACAYASHGDTKHVLLFPSDPTECFSMGAQAFDLAERLQTPVIVMSDLDIGMNEWVTDPFAWDDSARARPRQGARRRARWRSFKDVKGRDWGRYQDVDDDAIPYRTLPGTHPTKGAFFTRGTSHDEGARYTEDGRIHARVHRPHPPQVRHRRQLVPKPEVTIRDKSGKTGLIYFGATTPAVREALDLLEREGIKVNALRLKAFPFTREVGAFCAMHERVFVVEQNRDAQMRSLLMTEADVPGAKLIPALNYDGMPMTAAFVRGAVLKELRPPRPRRSRDTPMSYIAKPVAHHPALPKNTLGSRGATTKAPCRRCARGAGTNSITAALIEACFEMDLPAHRIAKVSGIGCSSKAPTYFLSRSHGFNSRARAHAVDHHRRRPRQPRSGLYRRLRRRRHGLDRARSVLPRRAPAREHELHRHEQRLLRPDQGPVLRHQRQGLALQEGRGQPVRGHRPVPDGDPARRRLRRPLVLRRQDAAHSADQGRHQLQRLRLPRRDQPVRDLQQPPDLDQELRLRSRPQHGLREPARLRRAQGGDHRRLCRGHLGRHRAARRLAPDPQQARPPARSARRRRRAHGHPHQRRQGRGGNRSALHRETQRDMHDILATDTRPLNALPMAELCPGSKALEAINARLR